MNDELKPCPFCGKSNTSISDDDYPFSYAVECMDCDFQGPASPTKELAVVDWNGRRPERELRAEVARLTAHIAELEAVISKYQNLEKEGNVLMPMPNPWGEEDEIYDQHGCDSVKLLYVLEDMVRQHCYLDKETQMHDSGALTANAIAMQVLAEHGRFEIDREFGRMVVGKFIESKGGEG